MDVSKKKNEKKMEREENQKELLNIKTVRAKTHP